MLNRNEKAAIAQLLQPYLMVKKIEILDGGLSNRCLKITENQGACFVWRPNSQLSLSFGIDRQNEFHALRLASEQKLSSPPVANLPQGLLTRWVEGEPLLSVDMPTIATLLKRVHQLPKLTSKSLPLEKGLIYFHHLKQAKSYPRLKKVHEDLQRKTFVSHSQTTIHCDLGYYNLIKSTKDVQIIDWEYAACGDPAFDLALTALANDFDLDELVRHYCEAMPDSNLNLWLCRANAWVPVTHYLAALWYAVGYEHYQNAFYWKKTLYHLEFL